MSDTRKGQYTTSQKRYISCQWFVGSDLSLWHNVFVTCLCGGLGWLFKFLEKCCCACSVCVCVYILCSFMVIVFEKPWVALFNHSYHVIIENDFAIFS